MKYEKEFIKLFIIIVGVVVLYMLINTISGNKQTSKPITREDQIKAQFSQWDGSHIELKKLVKSHMHDPSSFKHVESSYLDHGNYFTVYLKFRGSNAFGATVTNTAKATVNANGTNLKFLGIE